MKKVFLSLAVIATLTVVSCKQAEAEATDAIDSTAVEATEMIDSTAAQATEAIDSTATAVEAAATEAVTPAAH